MLKYLVLKKVKIMEQITEIVKKGKYRNFLYYIEYNCESKKFYGTIQGERCLFTEGEKLMSQSLKEIKRLIDRKHHYT
jgi:hypothetical protein